MQLLITLKNGNNIIVECTTFEYRNEPHLNVLVFDDNKYHRIHNVVAFKLIN